MFAMILKFFLHSFHYFFRAKLNIIALMSSFCIRKLNEHVWYFLTFMFTKIRLNILFFFLFIFGRFFRSEFLTVLLLYLFRKFYIYSLTCVYFNYVLTWFNSNFFPRSCRQWRFPLDSFVNQDSSYLAARLWRMYHFMKKIFHRSHVKCLKILFLISPSHFQSWLCENLFDLFFRRFLAIIEVFYYKEETVFFSMDLSARWDYFFGEFYPHGCNIMKMNFPQSHA